jgi:hypothetical protein
MLFHDTFSFGLCILTVQLNPLSKHCLFSNTPFISLLCIFLARKGPCNIACMCKWSSCSPRSVVIIMSSATPNCCMRCNTSLQFSTSTSLTSPPRTESVSERMRRTSLPISDKALRSSIIAACTSSSVSTVLQCHVASSVHNCQLVATWSKYSVVCIGTNDHKKETCHSKFDGRTYPPVAGSYPSLDKSSTPKHLFAVTNFLVGFVNAVKCPLAIVKCKVGGFRSTAEPRICQQRYTALPGRTQSLGGTNKYMLTPHC